MRPDHDSAGSALGSRGPRRKGRQAESLAYGTERPSMGRACAKPGERLIVSLHRVALVIGEAVAGMTRIEHPHSCVALDFSKDGSGVMRSNAQYRSFAS